LPILKSKFTSNWS